MAVIAHDGTDIDRDDERLWKTARAAFLDRYSRAHNLTPEEVAKWAVEGAVALHNEFCLQSTHADKAEETESKEGERNELQLDPR